MRGTRGTCKQVDLAERYGVAVLDAHRAEDDVRVLYEVMVALIGEADYWRVCREMASYGKRPIKRVALVIKAGAAGCDMDQAPPEGPKE